MEKTFICEDYDGLLDQYKSLRTELDVVKQQLYNSSRQSKLNEALLKEYQSEIELLQNGESEDKQKLMSKINQLEETIVALRLNHSENVSIIETELQKKELENENLKAEIELLKVATKKDSLTETPPLNETVNLQEENDILKENNERLLEAYQELQVQQGEFEKLLEQYKEESCQLKESLEIKRNELAENAILIEKLNDDLLCVRTELENYKSKPLEEGSKGNSLFAEVDDRRVYLQKTVNHIKTDYIKIKQERSEHIKQVSQLRKENADLQNKWRKDLEQIQEDKLMVNDSLRCHLDMLQEIVDRQKKELEELKKPVNSTLCVEYQFYQDIIDSKQKDIKYLEEKLSQKSLGEYLLANSLAQANKEIRLLRLKNREVEIAKDNIENKIDNPVKTGLEIKQPAEVERIPMKSCLKSKENISSYDNDEILLFEADKPKSSNPFDIFGNRKDNKKTTEKVIQDEVVIVTANNPEEIISFNNQETIHHAPSQAEEVKIVADDESQNSQENNKENNAIATEPAPSTKRGVTFSSDTLDNSSSRIQRRGIRIFSAPKKMF